MPVGNMISNFTCMSIPRHLPEMKQFPLKSLASKPYLVVAHITTVFGKRLQCVSYPHWASNRGKFCILRAQCAKVN